MAMNRTMNTYESEVAPTYTMESDGPFKVVKRERQRNSRTRQILCFKCGKLAYMMRSCGDRISANDPLGIRYKSSKVAVDARQHLYFRSSKYPYSEMFFCEQRPSRISVITIDSSMSGNVVSAASLSTSLEKIESNQIELANGMVVTVSGKRLKRCRNRECVLLNRNSLLYSISALSSDALKWARKGRGYDEHCEGALQPMP